MSNVSYTAADASARGVFEVIWQIFTNRYALGIYVILVLGLMIAVIAVMISEEGKLAALMNERTKRKTELLSQKIDVHVKNAMGNQGGGTIGKQKQPLLTLRHRQQRSI